MIRDDWDDRERLEGLGMTRMPMVDWADWHD